MDRFIEAMGISKSIIEKEFRTQEDEPILHFSAHTGDRISALRLLEMRAAALDFLGQPQFW